MEIIDWQTIWFVIYGLIGGFLVIALVGWIKRKKPPL